MMNELLDFNEELTEEGLRAILSANDIFPGPEFYIRVYDDLYIYVGPDNG